MQSNIHDFSNYCLCNLLLKVAGNSISLPPAGGVPFALGPRTVGHGRWGDGGGIGGWVAGGQPKSCDGEGKAAMRCSLPGVLKN